MRELIQTERDYVNSLEYIIEVRTHMLKSFNIVIFLFSFHLFNPVDLPSICSVMKIAGVILRVFSCGTAPYDVLLQ